MTPDNASDFIPNCDTALTGAVPPTHSGLQSPPAPRKRKQTRPRNGSVSPTMGLRPPVGMLPPVSDPQTLQEKRELLEYFQKLRVLVPSLPKTGKIPKLDVIEHVIHYIKELENQLIDHPMIHVLENNAYISGLLQSMAPEFDISHLFPARSSTASHSDSSQFPASSHSTSLPSASLVGGYSDSQATAKSKSRRSRASRKPLGLLSTANSTY